MTTVLMVDATHASVAGVPASVPKVAGYVTGTPDIEWVTADWARFPASGHVRIEQGYGPVPKPSLWDVLDIETGAWQPGDVPGQVKSRIAAGITWTTAYASDGLLAEVEHALIAAGPHGWYYGHVDCWLADWNLNEVQAAALVGQLVHGMTCRAVQWASPTSNPHTLLPGTSRTLSQVNCDLSAAAAGWHPAALPPPPPSPPPPPPALPAEIKAAAAQLQADTARLAALVSGL